MKSSSVYNVAWGVYHTNTALALSSFTLWRVRCLCTPHWSWLHWRNCRLDVYYDVRSQCTQHWHNFLNVYYDACGVHKRCTDVIVFTCVLWRIVMYCDYCRLHTDVIVLTSRLLRRRSRCKPQWSCSDVIVLTCVLLWRLQCGGSHRDTALLTGRDREGETGKFAAHVFSRPLWWGSLRPDTMHALQDLACD